ncbi:hypothetical protein AOLI_G00088750 [Acnodon oligacanthus]
MSEPSRPWWASTSQHLPENDPAQSEQPCSGPADNTVPGGCGAERPVEWSFNDRKRSMDDLLAIQFSFSVSAIPPLFYGFF